MPATTGTVRDPVLAIAGIRDPVGVLTLMASPDPASRHAAAPAAPALRRRLEELAADVDGRAPSGAPEALTGRWAEVEALLDEILDPTQGGRGRAVVLPLSGAPARVALWADVPDVAGLGADAHVTPLLPLREAARPAGLVAVSGRRVQIAETGWGQVRGLRKAELPDASGEWRRFEGPARSVPGRPVESHSQADLFATRLDAHRRAELAAATRGLAEEARARGWERVIVCGEPALADAVAEPLAASGTEVARSAVTPGDGWSPRDLADALATDLAAAAARARRRGATAAVDAARAHGGRGALGVDDVLTALVEGRVHHLLVVPEAVPDRYERLPDGRLAAAGEVPAGPVHGRLRRLGGLCDRMVAEAVARDAAVTALGPDEAPEITAEGGVAGLLRW